MFGVVDLSRAPDATRAAGEISAPGVTVAHGWATELAEAEPCLSAATFTLAEGPCADRRVITVESVSQTLAELRQRCQRWPQASAVCDDVLRTIDPDGPTLAGVLTESLAYSTLQAGPEFARWLDERGPADLPDIADPVQTERDDDTLRIRFNRAQRHNAFSGDARAALLEALTVAQLDPSVSGIVLSGNGPSFCSGGDLAEFGTFADPASAHLARTRHSPALALAALTARLGRACRAEVHGRVLGSGLEMAAFCGWVRAHPDSVFGLPELSLGLIPGAGGTVSVTRRIGRWRTAYLVLSGRTIDAGTALDWGLIDAIAVNSD
ncbi:2,3-dehydroadipyl-CoA hydratase [Mycobacterium marinum]|uniref:enoyl-CoA hydratase/isomerase family protein n=1 Tax=Mycobacterium marinum TaxID=1781 RepID=UPI000358C05C|nr:enoyl-CoA hydratase/isomerase family protein [Mycobacterium marinum]AXN42376.1 2,3-dehydroadipyl-CoA hydratase [Mycobacterium marinum]AXN47844.1 2,3-dehydroadipyl-CoA hydratase [Mycobacterium marinum]EPQ72695.1 Enoyl-CoA hydratase [Mycobacterium marinum str. Europe]RFZ14036.1 2,3-dehydroadipyl-CoA hydratase [Mycobacterium marinum]RFZ25775.1 2,3-dehydroadipyl-CoA hydratase [Mycobacterium marinum]